MTNFGPTGQLVYERTYSRTKPNGTKETWPDTAWRVALGNFELVYGPRDTWPEAVEIEFQEFLGYLLRFALLPAGRHLWASGVQGRQYLFNCFAAGTKVHLDDGIWSMDQLVDRGEMMALSEGGKYRPTIFQSFGQQEIWEVELANGDLIRTTAGHEWVLRDGRRVTTENLKVDDRLPYNLPERPEWDEDSEEGFAHGVVYGDGTMPKEGNGCAHILLIGKKRYLAERISKFGNGTINRHDEYTYVGGFPRGFRELPRMGASRSYWHGFIAGLIATDGTVNSDTVCIDQANLEDLDIIADNAKWVGLHPRQIKLTRTDSPFTGEYAPMYRLRFSSWSVRVSDLQRVEHAVAFPVRPEKQRTVSVKRVEATGLVEPVYCGVEPETHTLTIASGVLTGNCHVSGWGDKVSDHFEFTFLRLMEGGGVGANYSNNYLEQYPRVRGYGKAPELFLGDPYQIHIVCDPEHADYQKMRDAGVLSGEYDHEWAGSFEVEDSREGWAYALVDLVDTYYRPTKNANRVFDVSRVRPEGSRLKTFGGRASGPLPLAVMLREVGATLNKRIGQKLDGISAMEIDHAIAKCVVSGGNRRSARMAIMHWADPQVFDFIRIKATTGEHWTTNISVEVDDEFFERLGRDIPEPEDATPEDVRNSQALVVLHEIANGMLTNGEPGFWNSSLSNVGEPNPVVCTNPCGEIALEEWENCNLGHVNLAAFVNEDGTVDEDGMGDAHELMTRFLIRATYGDVNDSKQAEKLARNRRIGVGHLGVASFLALTGVRYSDAPENDDFIDLLSYMALRVDRSAETYAHDLRIPVPVKTRTVAPTGTIAKMPGVSEGIHPIFAKYFIRRIRFSDVDPDQMKTVESYRDQGYGVEVDQYAPQTTVVSLPTKDSLMAEVEKRFGAEEAERIVQSAADITLTEMLAFQRVYQTFWADNAVSYTVNIDPADYSVQDVSEAIREFGPYLKGATVFPELSMPQSPYERITKDDYGLYEDWQQQIADGVDENCVTGGCPIK